MAYLVVTVNDAVFEPAKHPRSDDGQFASVGKHKPNLSDVGKINTPELRKGDSYISELPFPGDTEVLAMRNAMDRHEAKARKTDTPQRVMHISRARIPIRQLVATQPTVSEHQVQHYARLGRHDNTLPSVIHYKDKYYIENGHHRAVARIRRGARGILASVTHLHGD